MQSLGARLPGAQTSGWESGRRRSLEWSGAAVGLPDPRLGKGGGLRRDQGPGCPPHAHTRPHLGSRTARLSWVFTQTLTQHPAARKKCGAGENGVPWQALNPGRQLPACCSVPPPRSPPPIIRPRNGKDSRAQASCGGWMELGGTQGAGPPLPGPSRPSALPVREGAGGQRPRGYQKCNGPRSQGEAEATLLALSRNISSAPLPTWLPFLERG